MDRKVYDKKKDEVVFHGMLYQCENFMKELKQNGKVKTAFGYYVPNNINDVVILPSDVIVQGFPIW